MMMPEGYGTSEAHARLLADSFERLLGRPLLTCEDGRLLAEQLFDAPFALLSHGTETDPVLNYGNRTALALWDMSWEAFTAMPSRLTAEPAARGERDSFMRRVAERGYADDYTGVRVSSGGRRFRIRNAIVWNLTDESGVRRGQAALVPSYEPLDDDSPL